MDELASELPNKMPTLPSYRKYELPKDELEEVKT
jgi:hypothetical protein